MSQWLNIDLYWLHNIVFHFWPKMVHPTARSLCDGWGTCWIWFTIMAWLSYVMAKVGNYRVVLIYWHTSILFCHNAHVWETDSKSSPLT